MSNPSDEQAARGFYDAQYGNFADAAYAAVRRTTWGEDIGQNSWLTADEWRTFAEWLDLSAGSRLLEVCSGSGEPALWLAASYGCEVTGLDINEQGVANANRLAQEQQLGHLAHFVQGDASQRLPFSSASFDALVCIDSINHLANRLGVFEEWFRVLRPGGKVVVTDPITVTGLLSNEEIATRSSIGFFLFAPPGEDERLLKQAGFLILNVEDGTENMAQITERWRGAREQWRAEIQRQEGAEKFEATQRFLSVAHAIAAERRLSRYIFLAAKDEVGR